MKYVFIQIQESLVSRKLMWIISDEAKFNLAVGHRASRWSTFSAPTTQIWRQKHSGTHWSVWEGPTSLRLWTRSVTTEAPFRRISNQSVLSVIRVCVDFSRTILPPHPNLSWYKEEMKKMLIRFNNIIHWQSRWYPSDAKIFVKSVAVFYSNGAYIFYCFFVVRFCLIFCVSVVLCLTSFLLIEIRWWYIFAGIHIL